MRPDRWAPGPRHTPAVTETIVAGEEAPHTGIPVATDSTANVSTVNSLDLRTEGGPSHSASMRKPDFGKVVVDETDEFF